MKFFSFFKKPKKDNLFNSHPDGIFIVESDGRIIDVNNALTVIFKRSRFDMAGQFFSKFIEGGSSLLNRIVKTKMPTVAKAFVNSKEEVYLELTASQSPDSGNVYVCAREVTKKHQNQTYMSAELEACKKIVDEKNIYLTNITGDITSHLSSVVSFSKALLDGIGGELSTKQEKYVQIINKNSSELNYDLGKMFDYFKLESGLYEYEEKNFDIVNLLNATINPYEEKFKTKMLNLKYECVQLSSRNCHHDPSIVENIISSLLDVVYRTTDVGTCFVNVSNPTLEFLQSKEMEAEEQDCKKYVLIEIKDNAQSYSTEDLENIFNPYYISADLPKRPVGTRFTYAGIKAHLRKMGGKIWIYSKPMQGNYTCVLIPSNMEQNG